MKATTVIKNADWIVAYDEQRHGHKYIRNGEVAFADDRLTYVGKNYEGQADEIIDGSDLLVMPGLLDLHLHAYQEIHGKGFFEDLASKHMWMTQLFEYTWLLQEDDESAIAAHGTSCPWRRSVLGASEIGFQMPKSINDINLQHRDFPDFHPY